MITVTKTDLPDIDEYIQYLRTIWDCGWIRNNGQFVQLLEKKFKVKNLALVSNGTLAIQIAIKSLKLKGEVLLHPLLFQLQ